MRTGRSGAGLHAVMSLVAVMGIGLCMPSWAFFPSGGFKQFENTPALVRWSMQDLDVTGDGQVQTPQDGVLVTIDIGEDGYTAAEAQAIREAFQQWQDVPGAYMAFRFQEIEGPFPVAGSTQIGVFNDPYNSVTLGDIGAVIGETISSFVIDEAIITDPVTGAQFLVRGPRILEADIILSQAFFRPGDDFEPDPENPISLIPRTTGTLRSFMGASVGLFSGLSFTPLNNLRDDNEGLPFGVEDAVMPYRGRDGVIRIIGATPTMYNAFVLTEESDGEFEFHDADLAHDDIAGLMYLYPRIEQRDDLFTISQEARTTSRPGFSSSPVVGAHVIAWVDHDRNPTTLRVPLFSTMSGLYNNESPIGEISGRFQLLGMFKRLIDENGNLFSPDYVISISPITEFPVASLDSMHTPLTGDARPADAYNTLFPFEVYNEAGNLFNRSNVRNGTPLYFDTVRRQVVSRDSGLTLSQQLPRNAPMFGEQSDVCFFDLIGDGGGGGGGGIQQPPGIAALPGIRAFRDNVMLRSRLGAAASDAYYRIAPPIASYLAAHDSLLYAARTLFAALLWLLKVPALAWAALAIAAVLVAGRRALRKPAVAAALLGLLVLTPETAHATRTWHTPEQMVQKSDDIIVGTVTAQSSYYSTDMLPATIVTDVSIEVSGNLKGALNKGSTVTIRVPGGQVGGHIVSSAAQPTFRDGEEVLLFVSRQQKSLGLTLPYGKLGTLAVERDEETEETIVKAGSAAGLHHTRVIARAVNEAALKGGVLKSAAEAQPDAFTLESFSAFVKEAESKARK
jgi:hypothetical protein